MGLAEVELQQLVRNNLAPIGQELPQLRMLRELVDAARVPALTSLPARRNAQRDYVWLGDLSPLGAWDVSRHVH